MVLGPPGEPPFSTAPLGAASALELRRLAGETGLPKARSSWQREVCRRALIDRGFIDPYRAVLTPAGRAKADELRRGA